MKAKDLQVGDVITTSHGSDYEVTQEHRYAPIAVRDYDLHLANVRSSDLKNATVHRNGVQIWPEDAK